MTTRKPTSTQSTNADSSSNTDPRPQEARGLTPFQYLIGSGLQLIVIVASFLGAVVALSNNQASIANQNTNIFVSQLNSINQQIVAQGTTLGNKIDDLNNRVTRIESRLGGTAEQPLMITALVTPYNLSIGQEGDFQVSITNPNPTPMQSSCGVFLVFDSVQPTFTSNVQTIQLSAAENRMLIFPVKLDAKSLSPGEHQVLVSSKDCPQGLIKSSSTINFQTATATPTP